jgi:PhnB protein
MILEASPVLIFNGNCEEAFDFYRQVFGGEYQFLYRYQDVPEEGTPANYNDKILHVSLPIMKNVNLMGTDDMRQLRLDTPSHVEIGLRLNDAEMTLRLFELLAEGGKVVVAPAKTFYADLYGSLIDRFGIGWSFNCNIGREPVL